MKLPFATAWIGLEIMLNKSVSETQTWYMFTYTWNLKNKTSEYNRETDSQIQKKKLIITSGEVEERRDKIKVED